MTLPSLAQASGWLGLAAIVAAGLVPLLVRLLRGGRAQLGTPPISMHVALGLATTLLAGAHTLVALPALGSPEVVGAGSIALFPGAAAFLVVMAHVGIGLQLRSPQLRARLAKRRTHLITASLLLSLVLVHAGLLLRG